MYLLPRTNMWLLGLEVECLRLPILVGAVEFTWAFKGPWAGTAASLLSKGLLPGCQPPFDT